MQGTKELPLAELSHSSAAVLKLPFMQNTQKINEYIHNNNVIEAEGKSSLTAISYSCCSVAIQIISVDIRAALEKAANRKENDGN